jgi:hypothetical protein
MTGPLCGGSAIRIPSAGSRSVITSQYSTFVVTPTPNGEGQVISAATFFGSALGGGGVERLAGGRVVCAPATEASETTIAMAMSCLMLTSIVRVWCFRSTGQGTKVVARGR